MITLEEQMRRRTINQLSAVLRKSLHTPMNDFVPGKTRIPLSVTSFGPEEIIEALDSMISSRVTMGEKVKRFEDSFADYIGAKYAVMVNSGSSANLLALSILTNPLAKDHMRRGAEVVTPSVTWSTTVFPIVNVGATPVLIDVESDTYNLNPDCAAQAVNDKTRAILPVHLLGNPFNIERILDIAEQTDLYVVEDACEAHGAEFNGKKVGSFGDLSSFSFYFSHHITTIEGGMVLTSNEEYAEIGRSLRAHGWIRDLRDRDKIAEMYPSLDRKFLFFNIGYNLRPTEIQGAFGIHQLKKLESFIRIRRDNAQYLTKQLEEFSDFLVLPEERLNTRHVWLGYPITVKVGAPFTRDELVSFLEERGIETRPIMAGNIAEHPAFRLFRHKLAGKLDNASMIMKNSFFFGIHQGVTKELREYIASSIVDFVKKRVKDHT